MSVSEGGSMGMESAHIPVCEYVLCVMDRVCREGESDARIGYRTGVMSVFVKMRDWRRVKERSWWWMVLYSDALMSGYMYSPFIHHYLRP